MKLRDRGSTSIAVLIAVLALAATLGPVGTTEADANATPGEVDESATLEESGFDTDAPFTLVSIDGMGDPHVDTTDGTPPSPEEIAAVEEALDFRIVEPPAHMAYATAGSSYFWRGGAEDLDVNLRTLSSIPDEAILVIKSVFEDTQQTIDMSLPDELWHEIDVNWDTSLPNGVLAGASTSWVTVNQQGTNFRIPLALYEILGGSLNTNNAPSMSITINANAVWDMTTQPSNQNINEYYLKTVLLHEVAHGLGFTSGVSQLSSADTATATPWSARIYGQRDLSLSLLDHGSSILQSNDLWLLNSDGTWERVFDPSTWQSGSSLSHLNEATYPYAPGAPPTPGALMTPFLQRGETSGLDGVVVGVLARLGYTTHLAPLAPTISVTNDDDTTTINLVPVVAGVSNVPAETWSFRIIDGANELAAQQSLTATQRSAAFSGLNPGTSYTAVVAAIADGNVSETSMQFTTDAFAPTATNPPETTTTTATSTTTTAPPPTTAQPPNRLPASSCLIEGNADEFRLDAAASASVYRLYCSYFLRLPDQGGFAYWLQQNSNGTDLRRISDFFEDSDEFKQRYGNLTDRAFVQLTYVNVLERQPDAGGYAYWVARLADGLSRGDLMLYFSDSPEFRERTDTA